MNSRNLMLALCCAAALTASAVPARKGASNIFTQPDGSQVSLRVVGDENHHYYLTDDDKVVIAAEGRYCYANVNANGNFYNTDVLAHSADERSPLELQLLSGYNTESVVKALANSQASRANSHDGVGLFSTAKFPTQGEVKALVFLVEYQDVQFTPGACDYFKRMIDEIGFSDNGATGSCFDYYYANSNGQFAPQFDVYGPVTLPNNRAYYGGNNAAGNDSHPDQMMLHAAQILNAEVDFSQYDTDHNGKVDNVFIFYAGMSEATGGGADCVWPHSWENTYPQYFDGVRFSRYACASELLEPNKLDGIGTFCHEFGHVLGLPDLYNTVDASVYYTPMEWDLLDQGCYNNDSRTPPALSAFERNALGWMGDNLIQISGPCSVSLGNLADCNSAVVINTEKSNEFFILENRQRTGYDEFLPNSGMLVWHIDYNTNKWNGNVVNNTESHQYVDIVEACGETYPQRLFQRRYTFPGSKSIRSFVYGGSPSFQSWAGKNLGMDITNIYERNGIITFDVAGGGQLVSGIKGISSDSAASARVNDRCITIEADGALTVTDLTGRTVASGRDSLTSSPLTPGIYIVSTPTSRTKVIVK